MVFNIALALLASSTPWYSDARCTEAANLVYSAQLELAEKKIAAMAASEDPDRQACALWVRATMKEMTLALLDDQEHLWSEMHDDLDALAEFGETHEDELRFADLIIEAEFRRVRVFSEQGHKTRAVLAARRAQKRLEARRRIEHASPTYYYAEAIVNLAITHADWHVRAALAIVGMRGNADRGKKAMKILLSRPSVYRSEAMVVARSFTRRVPGLFDRPLEYSAKLRKLHPSNPQLAFDHAIDLGRLGRCDEARATLALLQPELGAFGTLITQKFDRARKACRTDP